MKSLRQIANEKTKQTGIEHLIVELDYQDTRRRYVVPVDYLDSAEFEAFCGEVIE